MDWVLFPVPLASYDVETYPGELLWIPSIVHPSSNPPQNLPILYLPHENSEDLILFFHGNGEDIGRNYQFCQLLRSQFQCAVIATEYPGYGIAPGKPNEKSVMEACEASYIFATQFLKFQEKKILLLGRSIGTGPAVGLAAKYSPRGLILITPFISIRMLLEYHVGKLMSRIVKERFPNSQLIQSVTSRLLIIHGKEDKLIPLEHSQVVFNNAVCEKLLIMPNGMEHNSSLFLNPNWFVLPMIQYYFLPSMEKKHRELLHNWNQLFFSNGVSPEHVERFYLEKMVMQENQGRDTWKGKKHSWRNQILQNLRNLDKLVHYPKIVAKRPIPSAFTDARRSHLSVTSMNYVPPTPVSYPSSRKMQLSSFAENALEKAAQVMNLVQQLSSLHGKGRSHCTSDTSDIFFYSDVENEEETRERHRKLSLEESGRIGQKRNQRKEEARKKLGRVEEGDRNMHIERVGHRASEDTRMQETSSSSSSSFSVFQTGDLEQSVKSGISSSSEADEITTKHITVHSKLSFFGSIDDENLSTTKEEKENRNEKSLTNGRGKVVKDVKRKGKKGETQERMYTRISESLFQFQQTHLPSSFFCESEDTLLAKEMNEIRKEGTDEVKDVLSMGRESNNISYVSNPIGNEEFREDHMASAFLGLSESSYRQIQEESHRIYLKSSHLRATNLTWKATNQAGALPRITNYEVENIGCKEALAEEVLLFGDTFSSSSSGEDTGGEPRNEGNVSLVSKPSNQRVADRLLNIVVKNPSGSLTVDRHHPLLKEDLPVTHPGDLGVDDNMVLLHKQHNNSSGDSEERNQVVVKDHFIGNHLGDLDSEENNAIDRSTRGNDVTCNHVAEDNFSTISSPSPLKLKHASYKKHSNHNNCYESTTPKGEKDFNNFSGLVRRRLKSQSCVENTSMHYKGTTRSIEENNKPREFKERNITDSVVIRSKCQFARREDMKSNVSVKSTYTDENAMISTGLTDSSSYFHSPLPSTTPPTQGVLNCSHTASVAEDMKTLYVPKTTTKINLPVKVADIHPRDSDNDSSVSLQSVATNDVRQILSMMNECPSHDSADNSSVKSSGTNQEQKQEKKKWRPRRSSLVGRDPLFAKLYELPVWKYQAPAWKKTVETKDSYSTAEKEIDRKDRSKANCKTLILRGIKNGSSEYRVHEYTRINALKKLDRQQLISPLMIRTREMVDNETNLNCVLWQLSKLPVKKWIRPYACALKKLYSRKCPDESHDPLNVPVCNGDSELFIQPPLTPVTLQTPASIPLSLGSLTGINIPFSLGSGEVANTNTLGTGGSSTGEFAPPSASFPSPLEAGTYCPNISLGSPFSIDGNHHLAMVNNFDSSLPPHSPRPLFPYNMNNTSKLVNKRAANNQPRQTQETQGWKIFDLVKKPQLGVTSESDMDAHDYFLSLHDEQGEYRSPETLRIQPQRLDSDSIPSISNSAASSSSCNIEKGKSQVQRRENKNSCPSERSEGNAAKFAYSEYKKWKETTWDEKSSFNRPSGNSFKGEKNEKSLNKKKMPHELGKSVVNRKYSLDDNFLRKHSMLSSTGGEKRPMGKSNRNKASTYKAKEKEPKDLITLSNISLLNQAPDHMKEADALEGGELRNIPSTMKHPRAPVLEVGEGRSYYRKSKAERVQGIEERCGSNLAFTSDLSYEGSGSETKRPVKAPSHSFGSVLGSKAASKFTIPSSNFKASRK